MNEFPLEVLSPSPRVGRRLPSIPYRTRSGHCTAHFWLWPLAALATLSPAAPARAQQGSIVLATTTSTQDSGLLDTLVPMFRRATGIEVKVIAVGTGAALDMAARGDADAVLVHAWESEKKYVASGDLVGGRMVMHNDFLLVGPPGDPARVRGAAGAAAAMRAIAGKGPFISRGDASGTEKMELALWKLAGVDPRSVPGRDATGQGMGPTLLVADQRGAYTLTDRATYLAFRDRIRLVPVLENDPRLLNVYHAYVVNPLRHRGVKTALAREWVGFLVAPRTQRLIGQFGRAKYGQALFVPDAGKSEAQLGLQ
jgi:tungstate transport system substrate-binding protein